jgi:hypothetical protein
VNSHRLTHLLRFSLSAALPALGLLLGMAPTVAYAAGGSLSGTVKDRQKEGDVPIADAVVIIQCNCFSGTKETTTNSRGLWSMHDLPAGEYTVQAIGNNAEKTANLTLGRGDRRTVHMVVSGESFGGTIVVEKPMAGAAGGGAGGAGSEIATEDVKGIQFGKTTSPSAWEVADADPSMSGGAGGQRSNGNTSAENIYLVGGESANDPVTNRVAISVITPFMESVTVRSSGYDAEFGGASGAQIGARRRTGSDTVRGEAGLRFAPTLAAPRFITGTDEALRVTQVQDFSASAWAVVTGPIVKQKLHYTVGISPAGARNTLYQDFRARVDKDHSGGFEPCPFENGDNDCADGKNYIATERFAQQRFKTGGMNLTYVFGLDWTINPKHKLGFSVNGTPALGRTTFRLPFSSDPTAFGTNLDADPLGGTSNVANGIVNKHFGWAYRNGTLASLSYEGRVAKDKMEIDAGMSYFRSASNSAWRLDNPELRKQPATQYQDTQGQNLYTYLDRDGAVGDVAGVGEACNRSDLPGVACPVRVWLGGGIGEYSRDTAQRISGRLALTHFFDTERAGSHQLKYGGVVAYESRDLVSQYSGSNSADFYANCEAGETGGGEWCHNRDSGYSLGGGDRVNNHRFLVVDGARPEDVFSRGYGRVRLEEGDLRALADSVGRGVRVDAYESTLGTYNYAMYLQDAWAIRSNLSLNYGVRWEMQDMRDVLGKRAIFIKDNVAPRVGMSYDWTDEGRSRLYASYGWFYQPLPLALNSRVFGGLVNVNRQYRLADCQNLSTTNADGQFPRYKDGQPTEYCKDVNTGTSGLTTGGKVPNLKGQYNKQFQVGYEHEIVEDFLLGFRWMHTDLGRAVEDISTDGGQRFLIANPGEAVGQSEINAKKAECEQLTADFEALDSGSELIGETALAMTQCNFLAHAYERVSEDFQKPVRNYDAFTFEAKKRYAKGWILMASYTYSRLVGNYDGFVDPTTGAINLGASFQYDTPELVRNSHGPLSYDQPHRAKIDGAKSFDLGKGGSITVGGSFRVSSGFPINVKGGYSRVPGANLIHILPRGSGGRIEPNYRLNATVGWAYGLPKDLELEITARAVNVTNAKSVLRVDDAYSFQPSRGIPGGDLSDLKHAKVQPSSGSQDFFDRTIASPQGNYGVETSFQQPMAAQFEVALRF